MPDQNNADTIIPEKLIPDNGRASLRQMFDALARFVELHVYTDENSQDVLTLFTRQISRELSECSGKIKVVAHGAPEAKKLAGPEGLPSIGIKTAGAKDFVLRMVGAPTGQEGAALVKAIRMAGSGDSELSQAAKQSLAKLDSPREIMVFGSSSCPYCPGQMALAASFALERPELVSAYAISVGEFTQMAADYKVSGVPHTVVNNQHSVVGLQQDAPFAEFVLNLGEKQVVLELDAEQGFNPGADDMFGGVDFTAPAAGATDAAGPEAGNAQKTATGTVQNASDAFHDVANGADLNAAKGTAKGVARGVEAAPDDLAAEFAQTAAVFGGSGSSASTGGHTGQLGVVREKGNEFDCDLLVLGGGPAGLTAAVYGARSGLAVTVLDTGMLGGQVNLTPLVENYPGFTGVAGARLAESMVEHARLYAHVRGNLQITNLQAATPQSGNKFVVSTSNGNYSARAVLIATGSSWRKMGIPGELVFSGKGIHNCASCDGYLYVGKKVAIVGGGNAALTDALHLKNLGIDVTIIHRRDQFRGEDALAQAISRNGVKVAWDSVPLEIIGDARLTGIKIKNVKTEAESVLDVDGVFVCIGHEPNSRPAKALGAALNKDGSIAVDGQMRTSVPLVYAAGDVTGGFLQIVMAVAKGAQAAHSAFSDLQQQ